MGSATVHAYGRLLHQSLQTSHGQPQLKGKPRAVRRTGCSNSNGIMFEWLDTTDEHPLFTEQVVDRHWNLLTEIFPTPWIEGTDPGWNQQDPLLVLNPDATTGPLLNPSKRTDGYPNRPSALLEGLSEYDANGPYGNADLFRHSRNARVVQTWRVQPVELEYQYTLFRSVPRERFIQLQRHFGKVQREESLVG